MFKKKQKTKQKQQTYKKKKLKQIKQTVDIQLHMLHLSFLFFKLNKV